MQLRSPTLVWVKIATHWDDWRAHPRFQNLLHLDDDDHRASA